MKYKKYLKEKILEDGKIYEILNYQKTTNYINSNVNNLVSYKTTNI